MASAVVGRRSRGHYIYGVIFSSLEFGVRMAPSTSRSAGLVDRIPFLQSRTYTLDAGWPVLMGLNCTFFLFLLYNRLSDPVFRGQDEAGPVHGALPRYISAVIAYRNVSCRVTKAINTTPCGGRPSLIRLLVTNSPLMVKKDQQQPGNQVSDPIYRHGRSHIVLYHIPLCDPY